MKLGQKKHRIGSGYIDLAPSGLMEHSKNGPAMESGFESPIFNQIFRSLIKISTSDACLSVVDSMSGTKITAFLRNFLDISISKIDQKLFDDINLARAAYLGKNGSKKYRTVVGGFIWEVLKKFIQDWKHRQTHNIEIHPPIRNLKAPKKTYVGWKKLRDELQPNWKVMPDDPEQDYVKIFDEDRMNPLQRLERIVEGKGFDRVAFGPQFNWATPFFGGSNLWKYAYDGIETGWALINCWIRAGGMDFLPMGFGVASYTIPYPDAHSQYFYKWTYPSDAIVPQFIEKEILTCYEDLYDFGMTGLLQEITKRMIRDTLILAREYLYLSKITGHYFGPIQDQFLPYAQGMFATWDILPMWRGMIPFMKDMRKKPEDVAHAFEFINKPYTEFMLKICKVLNAKTALIGNSRGSNSWISPKMFKKIYWPSMKYTIERCIENGILPMCHLDNDWTENMEIFAEELPKRSCIFHLDQVDLVEIHDRIGDHFALMGAMSPGLLVHGTPEKVELETKRYIENVKECGLIIASGCEYPADTPAANIYAQKRAIKKYGFM